MLALLPALVAAQPARRDSIGWGEFVELFFGEGAATGDDGETTAELLAAYETLEELHADPLNLNTATRADLMRLPFIDAAKADSIVAYRDRRGFLALGELLFVRPLTYRDRLYLPLFVYVGAREEVRPRLAQRLFGGKYEVETRLDIPLYRRDGNRPHTRSQIEKSPGSVYLGNGLANVTRLRYQYGTEWAWGATFQKDAGEPFAAEGCVPFDYNSFYLQHRARGDRYEWIAGDYEVRTGLGLLFGSGFFLSKAMAAGGTWRQGAMLKAHTSSEENAFFRGAAGRLRIGRRVEVAAFVSYRSLDASFQGDTVLTLQASGLHRTRPELDRKDFAKAWTAGGRAAYRLALGEVGLTAYATHFSRLVWPTERFYNAHYFRGHAASGYAVDYALRRHRWEVRGELAADRRLHIGYTAQARYFVADELQFYLQHRHLSPRFVSLYGHTLQESSRCANEHGVTLGVAAQPLYGLTVTAYADAFILPEAVYRNHQRTRGLDAYVSAELRRHTGRAWTLTYRYKAKEQGVTGHADLAQFVHTHRATLRLTLSGRRLSLHPALTASLRQPQTGGTSFGWMASVRTAWHPTARWQAGGFAALFFSDDYQSALYAYEPQLLRQGGIPSFYYHGLRLVATLRARLPWGLEAGIRAGSTHYFNRSEISSGAQRIRSSWKNDVSLQLRWRFEARRR